MNTIADQLLVLAMLINFLALATSRVTVAIRAVAIQGVALGLLPWIISEYTFHTLLIAIGMVSVKGILIPWLITRAIRKVDVQQDVEPYMGYMPVMLIGALLTALSFAFSHRLPLAPQHEGLLFVPASIATLLAGCTIIVTRKQAINQVTGYLILENGIYIFGLLLTEAMPFMVEAGAILDLIVGIFVMGIIINQISREFSSIDTTRLSALKD